LASGDIRPADAAKQCGWRGNVKFTICATSRPAGRGI